MRCGEVNVNVCRTVGILFKKIIMNLLIVAEFYRCFLLVILWIL